MPTVNIRRELFESTMGKTYSEEELEKLCFQFGIEVEFYTEEEEKKIIQYNSFEVASNRVDLLCLEGIVRALKIFLGESTLKPITLSSHKSQSIIVEQSISPLREYVVGAVLKGMHFTQAVYDSFIDLQDKLHQNICRRRKLVSIGTHDLDSVQGPFRYCGRKPEDILFTPLNKTQEMDGNQLMTIYATDQKLKAYLDYIRDAPLYPVFLDSASKVMSLPPIINSDFSKISLSTSNVLIEVTATDLHKAHQVLDQLTANMSIHCQEVEAVDIIYEGRENMNEQSPHLENREMTCNVNYMNKLAGVQLSPDQQCNLLTRMALTAQIKDSEHILVQIDCNRSDVMHPCDIAEDIAIAYDYDNLEEKPTPSPTIGSQQLLNKVSDLIRQELAFSGYKECLNFALCSKEELSTKLCQSEDLSAITIGNPKTMDFQTARTTLIAGLMKTLAGNKNNKLPLDLFELSDVVLKDSSKEQGAKNQRRLCALHSNHNSSGFELIHGLLDYVMVKLNIPKDSQNGYSISESQNPTFFPGRQANVLYKGSSIGYLGIIHPEVLKQFDWVHPVSLLELTVEPLINHLVQSNN